MLETPDVDIASEYPRSAPTAREPAYQLLMTRMADGSVVAEWSVGSVWGVADMEPKGEAGGWDEGDAWDDVLCTSP